MICWSTGVRLRGPAFTGEAKREVGRYLEDVVHATAVRGQELVRADFDVVHREPTGYARSRVTVTDEPGPRSTVGDGGIVYGPWLEGVGSRNKTSRFKGYATFRRIGQRLQGEVERIARERLPQLVRRLNGGA